MPAAWATRRMVTASAPSLSRRRRAAPAISLAVLLARCWPKWVDGATCGESGYFRKNVVGQSGVGHAPAFVVVTGYQCHHQLEVGNDRQVLAAIAARTQPPMRTSTVDEIPLVAVLRVGGDTNAGREELVHPFPRHDLSVLPTATL